MIRTTGDRGWSSPPWRTVAAVAVAAALAAVTSVVVQFAVSRVHLPVPTEVPALVGAVGSLVAVLVLLALAVRGRTRLAVLATWVGQAAFTTWVLALPLMGTRYYFAGLRVDMVFRTQIVTRYTASPAWADMTYAGLPPYYPPTWFWLAGRLGALAGVPGWAMYKPWAIATMAVAVTVATALWSALVRRSTAALLGLATLVAGLHAGSAEPYAWLLIALMPPVVVLAWRGLAVGGPRRRWTLVGVGTFLGLAAAVYTLYLGFTAVIVVLLALVGARELRRAGASWAGAAGETALRLALTALPAAVIGLAVWGPYLLAAARAGFPTGTAPRFLPNNPTTFPFPFVEANAYGLLCLLGAAWIVLAFRHSAVARALAALWAAVYLWYVLSALALALGTTLLAFRVDPIAQMVLAAAGVFGGLAVVRRLPALVAIARPTVRGGAAVAAAVAVLSLTQPSGGIMEPGDVAYVQAYPTGRSATGTADPADPGTWTPGLVDAIRRGTARAPLDTIVLGGPDQLYAAEPYFGFQTSIDQFANPLADYRGRNRLIGEWTRAPDLARALDASPYPPPRVFVLQPRPDGLHLPLSEDQFPAFPNLHPYDAVFPPRLFASSAFVTETVGPFVVAVRRDDR